jgi:hypothetical protein
MNEDGTVLAVADDWNVIEPAFAVRLGFGSWVVSVPPASNPPVIGPLAVQVVFGMLGGEAVVFGSW